MDLNRLLQTNSGWNKHVETLWGQIRKMIRILHDHVAKQRSVSYPISIHIIWSSNLNTKCPPICTLHFQINFRVSYDNCCTLIQISWKFAPNGPINNWTALMWMMSRRQIGDKQLGEPIFVCFTDAYMPSLDELNSPWRWISWYVSFNRRTIYINHI